MKLVFRKLTLEDIAAYRSLRFEALETQPLAFGQSPHELDMVAVEEISAMFSAHDSFVIGAFDDQRLVGMTRFAREQNQKERHKGHIYSVYVTPSHLRRGVARSMILAIIAEMSHDASFEQLLLGTGMHNTGARSLYRSLGFVPYGIEPRSMKIGADYIDEEQMVLFLR